MKKIVLTFLIFSLIQTGYSQGINFQGVARSSNGTIIASSNVGLRLSIISKNVDATPEYIETKTVMTNAQGIFSIVVGDVTNTAVVGSFKNIVWADGPKFLKVEMDPAGGTNYLNMGATQLQYVPYSFYSYGIDGANVKGIVPVKSGGTGVATLEELKTALNFPLSIDTTSLSNRIETRAPLNNPTFSGTVTGLFKGDVTGNVTGNVTGTSSNITGLLSVGNGGTGSSELTANNVLLGNGTSALLKVAPSTSGNVLTSNGTTWISAPVPPGSSTFSNDININGIKAGIGGGQISSNTVFGKDALNSNLNRGIQNIAIGNNALNKNVANYNSAIGYYALSQNTEGTFNDALGAYALEKNTTGGNNIALGSWALRDNTTGFFNVAVGRHSLRSNTIGSQNTSIGRSSLMSNINGSNNTSIGYLSLYSNKDGNFNTSIGDYALYHNRSISNAVALGHNALKNSDNTSVAKISGNTAVGYEALMGDDVPSNNTGINNTGIGYSSLKNNTTGSNNTAIGFNSMSNNTNFNNSTAIGANAEVIQSNQIKLGDDNIELVSTSGIVSSGKGFLAKGINASQRDAIINPEAGLIIYCIDCGIDGEIQFFNGTLWKSISGNTITTSTQNSITLKSRYGSDNQFVTTNKSIESIVYSTSLATGATVSGLPNGATSIWNNNLLTISGTPTQVGTYTYTVTLTGGVGNITKTGKIIVGNLDVTLSSSSGTDSQTICESGAIVNITYITTGTSSVTITGLPNYVNWTFTSNIITISSKSPSYTGSPGVYNYFINVTDGNNSKIISGKIKIIPTNTIELISGTESQEIILNNAITPVIYKTTGANSVTVSSLATGLNSVWSNNQLTISGTPTSVGFSSFQINLSGGCSISYNRNNIIQVSNNCTYSSSNISGTYKVIKDDWGDWSKDDIVTISAGSQPNTLDLSRVYPNLAYGKILTPLIININQLTGDASLTQPIKFGDYGSNFTVTAESVSGKVNSCDGQINLKFNLLLNGTTNYGSNQLVLQKL
jgi:hypothetical protein